MKLYNYFRSSASFRVRIALALKGIAYDYVPVHLAKGEHKKSAYADIAADGLVPLLELDDGTRLSQSMAIIEYLWEMCVKTQHDITARMALVPRTLEARGLDATPLIQARLRKVGTPAALRAVDILDIILRDEVGHVAIGNRWYGWLCERQGLEPLSHYRYLARVHTAPRLRPPFNDEARRAAGFSQAELDDLLSA